MSQYIEILQLLYPSLLVGAAVAASAGTLGVFVCLRREALLALTVPQSVAVGAAIGFRNGWPALPPAIGAVAVSLGALAVGKTRRANYGVLPAIYISALCLTFLLIANSAQHIEELQNMLTGMDVTVSPGEAAVTAPILLLVGVVTAMLWRRWLLMAQAPAVAQLAGLSPGRWDTLFYVLLATAVLVGTDMLGGVIVLVMLFLPSGSVMPWVRRVPQAVGLAVALGVIFLFTGFTFSVEMDWPLSQSVGGVGFVAFAASNLAAFLRRA